MTALTSKSKPGIELQYGGRPFSKTGSSYISAVDWDNSSKFGMRINFHVLKQIPSLNLNPEVDFRLYDYGAFFKIRYDVITLPSIV